MCPFSSQNVYLLFNDHQNRSGEKLDQPPILPIMYSCYVIGTMLNFNGGSDGHLKR